MTARHVGRPITRNEDPELLRGGARFVNDIAPPHVAHACLLRSPHASARIRSIDLGRARALPGVLLAWTAAEIGAVMKPNSVVIPHPALTQPRTHFPLAQGTVRYAGEPVAFVVAANRYEAEDAVETIAVEYEPLPAVVDPVAALSVASPLVHEDLGTNLACTFGEVLGDLDAGFSAAARVFTLTIEVDRGAASPIETRGVVAQYEPAERHLTVWCGTQTPALLRNGLAGALGLLTSHVRVVAPHVGGAFGCKAMVFYPEDVLVPLAAMRLGRPVKWIEDRREHFFATNHERLQVHRVKVGVTLDGRLTALQDHFVHETGAYISYGPVVANVTALTLPGPYKIPNLEVRCDVAYTNKTLVSPYRGAGRPQAVFVMERVMRHIARELGLDVMAVRATNLIRPQEMPYDYGLKYVDGNPLRYDSGDYPRALQLALERIGYAEVRREQVRAREQGRLIGVGVAPFVEAAGRGPHEGALVRVDPSGTVEVYTVVATQGQGHCTTFAQLAAEELGVDPREVRVTTGDTGLFSWGFGTYNSRTAVTAGNAVVRAARRVRDKAMALAARLLEVHPADLELAGGCVRVKGVPGQAVPLGELATRAFSGAFPGPRGDDFVPGLEATDFFAPAQNTYPYGVHAVVVEVDPDTGAVKIHRYVVVHDCGRILNPLIVDGQVAGGVAQGLGNAFYERLVYDRSGQLLTASFMDYLLPTADTVPAVEIVHMETPSPFNPLGVKGAGEGGTIPVVAAFVEAVEDALAPMGVRVHRAPLAPQDIYTLLQGRDDGRIDS